MEMVEKSTIIFYAEKRERSEGFGRSLKRCVISFGTICHTAFMTEFLCLRISWA